MKWQYGAKTKFIMNLQKHHFIQEEKPERKKYGFHETGEHEFQKDLQEWERKYVQPEYDWVSFRESIPVLNTEIYANTDNLGVICVFYDVEHHNSRGDTVHSWCDKREHNAKVQYYNDCKVLFDGWDHMERIFDGRHMCDIFKKEKCEVEFGVDYFYIITPKATYGSAEPCEIDLFKMIMKETGIEL